MKTLGLVYYYIQPQGRSDPDATASAFGSVQHWGHGSLAITRMGSWHILMYFLQLIQIIRYEKGEKNYCDYNIQ